MKAHNFLWQGCFFFHYYRATSTTDWAQIFTGFLFYAYVEVHQVRRLPICASILQRRFLHSIGRWWWIVSTVFKGWPWRNMVKGIFVYIYIFLNGRNTFLWNINISFIKAGALKVRWNAWILLCLWNTFMVNNVGENILFMLENVWKSASYWIQIAKYFPSKCVNYNTIVFLK